jgi:hypothetical protein
MAKPKPKHGKKASRFKLRNAAPPEQPARNAPRAAGVPLSHGQTAIYTASGAAIAAIGCALLARYDVMPATFATGIATAVGATAAVVSKSPIAQAFGQGSMAAAGAQLGLVLLDRHYQENAAKAVLTASRPEPKKPSNAESLPPGALEAAYERARRRLAMAEAAGQMAA